MVWWPVHDPTVECCALLGVPRGVVVKEPAQPLRCLVECYVICAKMCVCTFFFCLHVYLCVRITRLYVQCVTFLQVHKALWNNMYQLKKKACRVKVTANVRAVRINMWMFGVVFVPVCKLSGTGIVSSGFVYATMMMRIELLLGNTVKCVRLLSACTGCVWLLCCVCVWVSIILWASCRSL